MKEISQSKTTISDDIWYDGTGRHTLLTRNGFINFILGGRGTGKTFSFKKWALTGDKQTVWVRRYQDDIDDLINGKFLSDMYREGILDPEEDEVRIENRTLYLNGLPKIFFVGLNTARKAKSQDYGGVDKIVFDELFELNKNKSYLKNEVELFLELLETVNRLRIDGRKEVRTFMLSNKTSWVNPYFAYWEILPFEGEFKTFKDGLIVVQNYENKEFIKVKSQTQFGRLVEGTAYGDYAIHNNSLLDDDGLIETRPQEGCYQLCNIRVGDVYLAVWESYNCRIYIEKGYDATRPTYTNRYEVKIGEYPLVPKRFPLKMFNEILDVGEIRFKDNIVKNYVYLIMQQGGK